MAVGHLAARLMKDFLPFNYKNIHMNTSLAYHAVSTIQFKVIYEGANEHILTMVIKAIVDWAVASAAFFCLGTRIIPLL